MNMHNDSHRNEIDINDRIVRQLDAESNRLDPAVQLRLNRARRTALSAEQETSTAFSPWPWLATAGAVSMTVFVVIALNQPAAIQPPASLDLDLLTMNEFDLLDQDPEFMTWLAEQDTGAGLDDAQPTQEDA